MNCACEMCKNHIPFEMPADIVESACLGDLVLFCGAGISTESKKVLPHSLYMEILSDLGYKDTSMSFSAVMQRYCTLPNGRKKLIKRIRDRFAYIRSFPELERNASGFHRSLAELYFVNTIVTTNWDTYFEDYCAATPITTAEDYAFFSEHERCVLKIHGSINNLSTLIATTDDYERCFRELQTNVIGGKLKDILARKTVVFIGFSFGDDDLNQIMEYVREQMKEFMPHIYVVSIDSTLSDRLAYSNATYITTDGTYFLHQLKKACIDKGIICDCGSEKFVNEALDMAMELHNHVAGLKLKENPCALFTLAYQDGVIHAFERFQTMRSTGEYNRPGHMVGIANKYLKMAEEEHQEGHLANEAYYEGYANALLLILTGADTPDMIQHFPFMWLPDALHKSDESSFEEDLYYANELDNEYTCFAKRIVGSHGDDIVIHHPPY